MSHLANADEVESSFNDLQVQTFKSMYTTISHELPDPHQIYYRHIANSAGIAKIADSFFTAGRSGIALY